MNIDALLISLDHSECCISDQTVRTCLKTIPALKSPRAKSTFCGVHCEVPYIHQILNSDFLEFVVPNICTVKLVCKDHTRDQPNVVLIHRWSLYASLTKRKVYLWRPMKCGLYKQVVFIYRWSLEEVRLYMYY